MKQTAAGLDIVQFDVEEIALRIEDFQVAAVSVFVAQKREVPIIAQGGELVELGVQLNSGPVLVHEGIFHFPKRCLDGFDVIQKRLPLKGFGRLDLSPDAPRRKNGNGDARAEVPDLGRPCKQIGEVCAGDAVHSGERYGREVSRFGDADPGVGGNQILLRLPDVRPLLQKIRRQSSRNRGQVQLVDGQSAGNGAGIATQKKVQGIFLLGDALLDPGNRGACVLVFGSHLAQLQLRDHAGVITHLVDVQGFFPDFERVPGNLQLPVHVPQIDIGAGNGRRQGQ